MKTIATRLEINISQTILKGNCPLDRYISISQKIIRRQALRSERIRLNKLSKTDKINGFERSQFPKLIQFAPQI